MNLDMERQIQEIGAVCDYVQAVKRSPKRLWLSFDEWNVWYRARGGRFANGEGKFAPRLLEEEYNLEDALLVGGFLNTLLRQAERVRLGVPGPDRERDRAARDERDAPCCARASTTRTRGRSSTRAGACSSSTVESESYPIKAEGLRPDFARDGSVPFLDVAATHDPQSGQVCLLMLNRDLTAERELQIDWHDLTPSRVLVCETLTGSDLKAANSFERPTLVAPRALEPPRVGSKMTFKLPPRSYSVAHIAT